MEECGKCNHAKSDERVIEAEVYKKSVKTVMCYWVCLSNLVTPKIKRRSYDKSSETIIKRPDRGITLFKSPPVIDSI